MRLGLCFGLITNMKECRHEIRKTYWVKKENLITCEIEDHLVDEWVSTWKDIDLHRSQCTECGKVEYYTGNNERYNYDE